MASSYDATRLRAYAPWAEVPVRQFFAHDKPLWQLLERNNIRTIGEILVRTKKELLNARGLGPGSLDKITTGLGNEDLYLREEWRDQGAAIRYTYNIPGTAPARILVPYRMAELLPIAGITSLGQLAHGGLDKFVQVAQRQERNLGSLVDSIKETLHGVNLLR